MPPGVEPIDQEMFGFLRGSKKQVPTSRRIGVDWGVEEVIAVLLDHEGNALDLRKIDAPAEDAERHLQGLEQLVQDWPLSDSHLVISLTRDYLITRLEVEEPNAGNLSEKFSVQLEYSPDEASFAWKKLQGGRSVGVAYPTSLLRELTDLVEPLQARSVHFEAVELAQARLLETFGLPTGLFTVHGDLCQITFLSQDDFDTLTQSTALLGMEQLVNLGLSRWKQRGQEPPLKLLTNLNPDYLARLALLPCEKLEEEAVAYHLALSPEGPQRFAALVGKEV